MQFNQLAANRQSQPHSFMFAAHMVFYLMEMFENTLKLVAGNPLACVRNPNPRLMVALGNMHINLPASGSESDGVIQYIRQCDSHQFLINHYIQRISRHVQIDGNLLFDRITPSPLHLILHKFSQRNMIQRERFFAASGVLEVEHLLNEAMESFSTRNDAVYLKSGIWCGLFLQNRTVSHDVGQRRSQFVGSDGDKATLDLIELAQFCIGVTQLLNKPRLFHRHTSQISQCRQCFHILAAERRAIQLVDRFQNADGLMLHIPHWHAENGLRLKINRLIYVLIPARISGDIRDVEGFIFSQNCASNAAFGGNGRISHTVWHII